jgi:hypothetical protein
MPPSTRPGSHRSSRFVPEYHSRIEDRPRFGRRKLIYVSFRAKVRSKSVSICFRGVHALQRAAAKQICCDGPARIGNGRFQPKRQCPRPAWSGLIGAWLGVTQRSSVGISGSDSPGRIDSNRVGSGPPLTVYFPFGECGNSTRQTLHSRSGLKDALELGCIDVGEPAVVRSSFVRPKIRSHRNEARRCMVCGRRRQSLAGQADIETP